MFGEVLYLVAGGLATFILQALKGVLKLEGRAMMWAAVLVSLGLGMAVTGLTSGWAVLLATPWVIFTGGSAVWATSTVIYKELAAKFDLSLEGMEAANGKPATRTAAPTVVKVAAKRK